MGTIARRTVDELNDLAEKMYGTNPKARTDAEALNYIEQNYTGGSSSGGNELVIELPTSLENNFMDGFTVDNESTGDELKLYNNIVEVLGNENILHSTIRFIDNGVMKINAVMSYYKDEQYSVECMASVLSFSQVTVSAEVEHNIFGIVTIDKITNGDYYGYFVKFNYARNIGA